MALAEFNGTLAAATVATVTFVIRYNYITVQNLEETFTDASIIYVSNNTTNPTVGGADFFAVDPGQTIEISNGGGFWWQSGGVGGYSGPNGSTNPGTTIKLISAGTPAYSVSGVA